MMKDMPKNTFLSKLMTFDFASIAGGNIAEGSEETFKAYLIAIDENLGKQADDLWQNLLNAQFGPLEEALGVSFSNNTKKAAIRAEAEK
jgi:hypothetical protein